VKVRPRVGSRTLGRQWLGFFELTARARRITTATPLRSGWIAIATLRLTRRFPVFSVATERLARVFTGVSIVFGDCTV